ncbi:MAG: TlpA family protein disulfide reductase [bacterium]|nr:TlpA family protein disulfide reductase [bacterium]
MQRILILMAVLCWGQSPAIAQGPEANATPSAVGNAPASDSQPSVIDLTIPEDASPAQLQALLVKAKAIKPRSTAQYQQMQTAIRDASKGLLAAWQDRQNSAEYRQAELDMISSSVLLMTFAGPDAQQKTMEQVHRFLKSRKTLSLSDIQSGMMAAAMLELQPNKTPATETYQLLDELLKNDKRADMQALRLNLQANVRRLSLLGQKMELSATTLNGDVIDINDYADRFLIVSFFAVQLAPNEECQACLTELEKHRQYYTKYHDRGLEIISISVDADEAVLRDFLAESPVAWPVIHDAEADPLKTLQMQFGISQLPTVMLLNKEGTVVSLEARSNELDRLMQMLFEAPTPAPAPAPAPVSPDSNRQTQAESTKDSKPPSES